MYVPKTNMPSSVRYEPHMPISSHAHIRQLCQYICLIYVINSVTRQKPMNKYVCNIAHVCPTALLLWSTYQAHIAVHASPTKNNLQQVLHTLLQNICQNKICPSNALLLWSTYRPHITVNTSAKKSATGTTHTIAKYLPESNMPIKCTTTVVYIQTPYNCKYKCKKSATGTTHTMSHMSYMYKLVHVQISDKYVSKYTSCYLTAINNVTRSTATHSFHILSICH